MGIAPEIWNYLDIIGVKQGKKPLELALKDTDNLESGLRLKIKNYINRNRVYIDGKWIEKKRVDLEPIVVKKMCADEVTFKELRDAANAYNANNFTLINAKGHNVGNMPADICNALAPMYDAGHLILMMLM